VGTSFTDQAAAAEINEFELDDVELDTADGQVDEVTVEITEYEIKDTKI